MHAKTFFFSLLASHGHFCQRDWNNPDAGIKFSFTSPLLLLNIKSCYQCYVETSFFIKMPESSFPFIAPQWPQQLNKGPPKQREHKTLVLLTQSTSGILTRLHSNSYSKTQSCAHLSLPASKSVAACQVSGSSSCHLFPSSKGAAVFHSCSHSHTHTLKS